MSDVIINKFHALSYINPYRNPVSQFYCVHFKMSFPTVKHPITENLRILSSLFIGSYCCIPSFSFFCFLPCVANIPNHVQYRFLVLSSLEYYLVSSWSSPGQYLLVLLFPLGAPIMLRGGPPLPFYLCFHQLPRRWIFSHTTSIPSCTFPLPITPVGLVWHLFLNQY